MKAKLLTLLIILSGFAYSRAQHLTQADGGIVIDKITLEPHPLDALTIPGLLTVSSDSISDTIYNKVQVSFLPFMGTTYKLNGRMINDYSLNIIGGYALGSRRLELASVFNIDRGKVSGAQIAGFANFVGQGVKGVQTAGAINMIGGKIHGAQLSGFLNFAGDTVKGAQLSGFTNFTPETLDGAQITGFFNYAKAVTGSQISGFANITPGVMEGPQVAGFFNYAKEISGPQVSGFCNFSQGNVSGSQVAGFANIAGKKMNGIQVSGFLNSARHLNGMQIGFINFADTCEKGLQLGFLNIVKKGYHKMELSADDRRFVELAFKTGTNRLYNIFSVGVGTDVFKESTWSIGYGMGTSIGFDKGWALNMDAVGRNVNVNKWADRTSLVGTFSVGMEKRIAKGFAVALSPEFNVYIVDKTLEDSNSFYSSVAPYHLFREQYTNMTVTGWVGGRVALRFF